MVDGATEVHAHETIIVVTCDPALVPVLDIDDVLVYAVNAAGGLIVTGAGIEAVARQAAACEGIGRFGCEREALPAQRYQSVHAPLEAQRAPRSVVLHPDPQGFFRDGALGPRQAGFAA